MRHQNTWFRARSWDAKKFVAVTQPRSAKEILWNDEHPGAMKILAEPSTTSTERPTCPAPTRSETNCASMTWKGSKTALSSSGPHAIGPVIARQSVRLGKADYRLA